jgi:hypothetical protein
MKIIEETIVEYKTNYVEITDAKYISEYKVRFCFNNGKENVVDFENFLLKTNHPSIQKYLNLELFKTFRIIDGNLNWNDLDLIFPLADLYKGNIF